MTNATIAVNVGDKFKVIANKGGMHRFKVGEVVTLTHTDFTDNIHHYKNDFGRGQFIPQSDVKAYEPEANKFNVGDKVTILAMSGPYYFEEETPGEVTSTDAHVRGHRGKYMVAVASSGGGTYEIGFAEDEIFPSKEIPTAKAKQSAKAGDYIVIDLEATDEGGASTVDITEGKAYLVEESRNGALYFNDDDGDYRSTHIVEGFYDIVDSPSFNVGDYVVALPEADEKYSITTTDMPLAKVLHTDEDHFFYDSDDDIKIEYLGDNDLRDSTYEVNSKFFRKATEEEIVAVVATPVAEVKFEVGDIVRITSDTSSVNEKGDIGEVVRADPDKTFRVSVNARKGDANWHIAESVELIAKGRK